MKELTALLHKKTLRLYDSATKTHVCPEMTCESSVSNRKLSYGLEGKLQMCKKRAAMNMILADHPFNFFFFWAFVGPVPKKARIHITMDKKFSLISR